MKKILYVAILIIVGTLSAHAQQMYRWTDNKGVVHYTEYAPDEIREQIININPLSPPSNDSKGVTKMDMMQPTQAVLIEIQEKKRFSPEERNTSHESTETAAVPALDPSSMTYCETIFANIATFEASERGDIDQILFVSQSGVQARVTPEEIQQQYKATIDNLEKHCLQ